MSNLSQSDEYGDLRDGARRLLREQATGDRARALMSGQGSHDKALWLEAGRLGWTAIIIPQAHGGVGLGIEPLSILALEVGRRAASIPLTASATAAWAIQTFGTAAQQARWLPGLASGETIACVGFAAAGEAGLPRQGALAFADGLLSGELQAVAFGNVADLCIAWASGSPVLIDLAQSSITREPLSSIDNGRAFACISFANSAAEPLGDGQGRDAMLDILRFAGLITAFEQVGGAEDCLEQAIAYAMQRVAFGQPIAKFQAIKHMLAKVYASIEVARGAALRGVAAAESGTGFAARSSAARIGATAAYELAARDNVHVHGGIGVTWESDCHIHYRRARALALELGSIPWWRNELVDAIVADRSLLFGDSMPIALKDAA